MKAVVFHEFGNSDVLQVEELPEPTAGHGEVVVDITAAALNHLDVDVREGVSRFPVEPPHVLGVEVVGRIADVGDGVDGWAQGDRVMPYIMSTCGNCRYCASGRESLCTGGRLHQLHDRWRLRRAACVLGATADPRAGRAR